MTKLDTDEKAILDAYEASKLKRARGANALLKEHREAAGRALRKDARINLRLTSRDLRGLQKRALAEGIPYQTLAASILHKYVEGRLSEDR
jgi:predicted DNA binding CopG/RHH family protein